MKNTVFPNAVFLAEKDKQKIYELPTQPMLDIPDKDICNVMVIGQTGVGKSTYLNSLVNELVGVEMNDDFRYVIIQDCVHSSTKSATTEVNFYGIPKQGKMKKALRLIDVPGLGDTGGISKDQQNIANIKKKLSHIPTLNLIIYIFKATETRVTPEIRYVMDQVMGIFGRDLACNFLFVLTFADFMEPNVKAALES